MFADSQFAQLCPDAKVAEWCLSPPSDGTCSIAIAPSSAPVSLLNTLIQADAYAVTLLGYTLTGDGSLDFFHAGYALLLAFSTLSPPWAVTGRKSPAERARQAQDMVAAVLSHLEKGHHRKAHRRLHRRRSSASSSGSGDEHDLLPRGRRKTRARIEALVQDDPSLFGLDAPDRVTTGQVLLLAGFFLSLLMWALAYWQTVLGGATGKTMVKLAQPNCTAGLGNVALMVVYGASSWNTLFLILGVVLLVAMSVMNLLDPAARCLGRTATAEYNGSPKLVFGASLLVWASCACLTLILSASLTDYDTLSRRFGWSSRPTGQKNVLASLEFSWSFGTTFSILMLIVPIGSIVRTYRTKRAEDD
ncbi:hypothetical protein BMF94_5247 [Rhodotorula taiwanensis]|uniref:Uncharacterized protein n=1 Tax=Rhodotorula taiwanensis TaxID=741276 RepID=A0A2S5B550_9BASI|nr:hypothetical protein BMF94_5247 [Rhodotorula taiwanensis]